jgi:hypothetical protein
MSTAEQLPRQESEIASLSRDCIAVLIAGVKDPERGAPYSWNVVEALEVLMDAGQLFVARSLAQSIQSLLSDDGRARLFRAYEALAGIVIDGELTPNLITIERTYNEIFTMGHSQADRLRITLVRARALGLGVAMKGLPETELLTARALIEQEFLHAMREERHEIAVVAGLELIKVYLYAPHPELIAAGGILAQLEEMDVTTELHADLRCDLARFRYHIDTMRMSGSHATESANLLRAEMKKSGDMACALGELTIARVAGAQLDRDALERTLDFFQEAKHSSALCEACLLLAGESTAKQHYARAQRFFTRALHSAREGGSCYVKLLALFGLFQSAWTSGASGESKLILKQVHKALRSELCLSAFGLNAVAAYQLTREYVEGEKLARRCISAAKKVSGLSGIHDQALHLLAGCLAGKGAWQSAARFYGEAADLAEKQRSFSVVCERRLAMIQAVLMHAAQSLTALPPQDCKVLVKQLLDVEDRLSLLGVGDDVVILRGRLEQLKAQVLLAARDFVSGVKHLSAAREMYVHCSQVREVAIVDACLGVALIEVAKVQGNLLFDESAAALQRSLEFFDAVKCPQVAWKVRFYLASTAATRSGNEADQARRLMWREIALSWLDGALADRKTVLQSQDQLEDGSWANEFAPHLTFDDLDALRNTLRPAKSKSNPKPVKQTAKTSRPRFRGQLH